MHERDQDTDLALLIVRKFIRTVSPHVRFTLVYFYTAWERATIGHVNNIPTMHFQTGISINLIFYH